MHTKIKYASLAMLGLTLAIAQAQETYKIKFDYPSKVGDKYQLKANSSLRIEMASGQGENKQTRGTSFKVDMNGEIEVLEVSDKGLETKIACKMESCSVSSAAGRKGIFKRGDVVIAKAANGKCTYTVKGAEVSAEAAQALDSLFSLHSSDKGEDDIFGTDTPKRVGERWPIKAKDAMSGLFDSGSTFHPKKMQGECQLLSIREVDGQPCLNITATIKVNDFGSSLLPTGAKFKDTSIEGRFGGLFLVNGPRVQETESLKAKFKFEGAKAKKEEKADDQEDSKPDAPPAAKAVPDGEFTLEMKAERQFTRKK